MSGKKEGGRADIYARITERIIADLAKGVRPWVQPWSAGNATGRITRPLRHNGEPYTGMNVLLLWSEGLARGFTSSIWMTFKQSIELGGHVRKGESGSTVIYASRFTKTETDEHGGEVERDIPFLKAYNVFNVEQIEGLPAGYYAAPAPSAEPVERIDTLIVSSITPARSSATAATRRSTRQSRITFSSQDRTSSRTWRLS